MTKNIVLIGMMGSGKSMAAKALSKRLKRPVFSTDKLIELKAKQKIKTIVATKGWDHFRALEHKIVGALSKKRGIIIDCGGGVILNPSNFTLLKKNGTIFYLEAKPAVILKRIKNDTNRPLLNVPNPLGELKRILKERLPLYRQADVTVDANDPSIDVPVGQILAKVES